MALQQLDLLLKKFSYPNIFSFSRQTSSRRRKASLKCALLAATQARMNRHYSKKKPKHIEILTDSDSSDDDIIYYDSDSSWVDDVYGSMDAIEMLSNWYSFVGNDETLTERHLLTAVYYNWVEMTKKIRVKDELKRNSCDPKTKALREAFNRRGSYLQKDTKYASDCIDDVKDDEKHFCKKLMPIKNVCGSRFEKPFMCFDRLTPKKKKQVVSFYDRHYGPLPDKGIFNMVLQYSLFFPAITQFHARLHKTLSNQSFTFACYYFGDYHIMLKLTFRMAVIYTPLPLKQSLLKFLFIGNFYDKGIFIHYHSPKDFADCILHFIGSQLWAECSSLVFEINDKFYDTQWEDIPIQKMFELREKLQGIVKK